jgi:hypothetical protein
MTVRIVEIDAAAAKEVVNFAGPLAAKVRIMRDAGVADPGECRVEFNTIGDDTTRLVIRLVAGDVSLSRIRWCGFKTLVKHGIAPMGARMCRRVLRRFADDLDRIASVLPRWRQPLV